MRVHRPGVIAYRQWTLLSLGSENEGDRSRARVLTFPFCQNEFYPEGADNRPDLPFNERNSFGIRMEHVLSLSTLEKGAFQLVRLGNFVFAGRVPIVSAKHPILGIYPASDRCPSALISNEFC